MNGLGAFGLGVAAALTARMFGPQIGRALRPAARGAIKQGIILSQGAQARAAELREDLEDLMAEARAEAQSGTSVSA